MDLVFVSGRFVEALCAERDADEAATREIKFIRALLLWLGDTLMKV